MIQKPSQDSKKKINETTQRVSLYPQSQIYLRRKNQVFLFLFFFYFVCFCHFPLKKVSPNGNVTNTGKGLRLLTYIRHSWGLRSECSLVSPTVTGFVFFIVIFEDPLHWNLLPTVQHWSCQNLLDSGFSQYRISYQKLFFLFHF